MTKIDKILSEVELFKSEHPKEWADASGLLGGVFAAPTAAKAKAKYASWSQLESAGAIIGDAARTVITRKKLLEALDLLARVAIIVLDSYKRK